MILNKCLQYFWASDDFLKLLVTELLQLLYYIFIDVQTLEIIECFLDVLHF